MIKLREHQEIGSNYIATNPKRAGIIAHVTGSGKSVTMLTGALKLYATRKVGKHIMVATVSSISETMLDMEQYFNLQFFQIKKEEDFTEFMNDPNKIFGILTYGVLKRLDPEYMRTKLEVQKTAMYFDEAQELKNEETVAQKHVRVYRDALSDIYLITATPAMSSAKDLQGLFWLLDPTLLGTEEEFYKIFSNYRMVCYVKKGEVRNCRCGGKYVYDGKLFVCKKCGKSYQPKKILEPISYINQKLLAELVAPYMNCFFPPRDLRYYKIVTEDSLTERKQYDAVAKSVLTSGEEQHSSRMIKLQHHLDASETKRKILYKLAEKLKDKGMIIYSDYLATVDIIENELKPLGVEIKSITGRLSAAMRKDVRNWFRAGAQNKVLIITKAGGASLNLQSTNNLIFYDIPFSMGNFIQVVGRVARYFSDFQHYNIFFPIIKDTLDDYKFSYVSSRKSFVDEVLQNKCLPQGELENYNADLLRELRKRTLWKREL